MDGDLDGFINAFLSMRAESWLSDFSKNLSCGKCRNKRACKIGRRQVLSGPFPPMLHEKLRKYTQVFPQFFILPERKNPRSKLLCTWKREIFLSGEAKSAEILELYFEHFQRSMTGKDPFSGCRIPSLHALKGGRFLPTSGLFYAYCDKCPVFCSYQIAACV